MRTIKEDALETARLLGELRQACATLVAAEAALHQHLRRAVYQHRDGLGLTGDDVAEIDNHGFHVFGGVPKDPPPKPE